MRRISDSILDNPHRWAFAVFLAALCVVLLVDVRPAIRAWGRAPQQIQDLTAAVELVPRQIVAQVLPVAQAEIQATRRELLAVVDGQASGIRNELFPRVDVALGLVDQAASSALKIVDLRAREALEHVGGLRSDLQPSLASVASITGHAEGAAAILFRRDALPAQVLGVLGGAKVALGETAQTMRTVDAAMPAITANIERATNESAATAQQTRVAMQNFAEATKPLPKWLRYPLSITGAIAPTVAGAVSTAAATGAFR